jgi:hypothetical protein
LRLRGSALFFNHQSLCPSIIIQQSSIINPYGLRGSALFFNQQSSVPARTGHGSFSDRPFRSGKQIKPLASFAALPAQ